MKYIAVIVLSLLLASSAIAKLNNAVGSGLRTRMLARSEHL